MEKELKLVIQPKVIDHLGIKMYQKPVDVVAEFIANSWDADAELVSIDITDEKIIIQDNGIGMTFKECQDNFLTVGRDRRKEEKKETTSGKERPVLGRKGIGKFAGFGIAKKIAIKTVSKDSGEITEFELDIDEILLHDANNENSKPIKVISHQKPDQNNSSDHGSIIILEGIKRGRIKIDSFKKNLARRFLLPQFYADFIIKINGEELSYDFEENMEFVFPRDLSQEEIKAQCLEIDCKSTWAKESLNGYEIKWRTGFFEEPIQEEEMRGISIFAKGKMAQKPFFFDLTGGISAQYGLEYMYGQVLMDFIDSGDNDLIATERQRINLQTDLGGIIRKWGIDKIKKLSSIWKQRRSQKRLEELDDKLSGFKDRLERLSPTERKTVRSVLLKIAGFERLGKARYQDWCNDILTSWEKGRLRELLNRISNFDELDEHKFLDLLSEAGIITALNIAESIKTKILTVGELKQFVIKKELENQVRDYIYENPWLIHPNWESFRKERSVDHIIRQAGIDNLDKNDSFKGRVDLTLASGSSLLLVEFMRPGLEIDKDHLDRINWYVTSIREALKSETGIRIKKLDRAYVIADKKKADSVITARIGKLEDDDILILTWQSLIEKALEQWIDYLEMLKERYPDERRIQDL